MFNIMVEDKFAYYASQAVYGSGVHHDKLVTAGYDVDEELTDSRTKTYVKNGTALVAYKGTDPTNIVDLDADVTIAMGTQRFNPEFKKAVSLAQRAKEKYGVVHTTGHSLGGTKAIESANAIGGKATVFNPGTGLFKLDTGDHRTFVNRMDPISARVRGSNIDYGAGGHSLDNFENRFGDFKPKVSSGVRAQASGVRRGVGKKRGWRV